MKEKKEPTKIIKGGFRATLALIFSIIALIFSLLAYYQTTDQTKYQTEIQDTLPQGRLTDTFRLIWG